MAPACATHIVSAYLLPARPDEVALQTCATDSYSQTGFGTTACALMSDRGYLLIQASFLLGIC